MHERWQEFVNPYNSRQWSSITAEIIRRNSDIELYNGWYRLAYTYMTWTHNQSYNTLSEQPDIICLLTWYKRKQTTQLTEEVAPKTELDSGDASTFQEIQGIE